MQKPETAGPCRRGPVPAEEGSSYTFVTRLDWFSAEVTVYQLFPVRDHLFLTLEHFHSVKEICYIASGSGYLSVAGEEPIPVSAGMLCYVNTEVPHRLAPAGEMDAYNLSFSVALREGNGGIPDQVAAEIRGLLEGIEQARFLTAWDTRCCARSLWDALAATQSRYPGECVKVAGGISSFLMGAVQALTGCAGGAPLEDIFKAGPQLNAVKIVTYLRRHYRDRLTLPGVAQALHYSPRQCQRLLHECLGVGFSELLLSLRIDRAKELLAQTGRTIDEIAASSGFSSGRSFSRQFTALEGISPSQYRRQLPKKRTE